MQACRIVRPFFRLEVLSSLGSNWVGSNWEDQLGRIGSNWWCQIHGHQRFLAQSSENAWKFGSFQSYGQIGRLQFVNIHPTWRRNWEPWVFKINQFGGQLWKLASNPHPMHDRVLHFVDDEYLDIPEFPVFSNHHKHIHPTINLQTTQSMSGWWLLYVPNDLDSQSGCWN